jgi:hypothetical protein
MYFRRQGLIESKLAVDTVRVIKHTHGKNSSYLSRFNKYKKRHIISKTALQTSNKIKIVQDNTDKK